MSTRAGYVHTVNLDRLSHADLWSEAAQLIVDVDLALIEREIVEIEYTDDPRGAPAFREGLPDRGLDCRMTTWRTPPQATAEEQADARYECDAYDDRAQRKEVEEITGVMQLAGRDRDEEIDAMEPGILASRRDDEIHERETLENDTLPRHVFIDPRGEQSDEEWLAQWKLDEMDHVFAE